MIVKFYGGSFSNFSPHPVILKGKVYQTVEHWFQSQKSKDPEIQEIIRCSRGPGSAKALGRTCNLREDWETVKEDVMMQGLRAKFTQHSDVREELLATGDALIIEDSPTDWYWGVGSDGRGANRLGYLLMLLRDELRSLECPAAT